MATVPIEEPGPGRAATARFVPFAAGFILTAAPNWTRTPPIAGTPLALLAGLWLFGRIGLAGLLPSPWAVAADVVFLPALALAVGPTIIRHSGLRNGALLGVLLGLAACNAAFHLDLAPLDAGAALRLAAGIFVLLIAMIGGRIVPAFTQSGLHVAGRAATIGASGVLDGLAIGVLALAVALDAAEAAPATCAAAAGTAALLHAVRLARWQGWRTADLPIVLVLHAGYAWVPAGAALLAAAHLGWLPRTAGLHAWGAGAVGTMLIAVMSRASLGHGGRVLAPDASTVAAYCLVFAGAALRVGGAVAGGRSEMALLTLGGGAWSLGYLLFGLRFLPIWLRPRADGRPG
ncbi:MAG: NnrS family protein [Alphaproteobacteria bacterium]